MEKDWPPLEECAQYRFAMIHPYLDTFEFEINPDVDDSYHWQLDSHLGYDDMRTEEPQENTHQTALRFLRQVRESRGYDVDCYPPYWLNSPFYCLCVESLSGHPLYSKVVPDVIEFAVDTINDEIKPQTDKTYKFKELKKAIQTRNLMLMLTFTITEDTSHNAAAGAGEKTIQASDTDADADEKTIQAAAGAGEKTIQAMVFVSPTYERCKCELLDWRVKPVSEDA